MGVVGNSIKDHNFRSLYLLYGEEAYLRNYYKNELKRALVSEGDTLNYSYYEGNGTNPDEVAGMVQTMPFLAEHRVVIVENSGWFGGKSGKDSDASDDGDDKASGKTAALQNAIKEITEDVIVIFVEEKVDKRNKLFKLISLNGIVEEFMVQTEDSLAKWVAGYARSMGKSMDAKTAYYLVSEVGLDMTLLQNELNKLTAWALEKDSITIEDVDTVCTHQVNNKIFDMIAAISNKKQKEALDLYYDLLTLRESPFAILSLLVRQYTQMLQVRDCMNRNEPASMIASKMGAKDWVIKRLIDPCRKMTSAKIRECLEACAVADEDIKQGNISDLMSVELLIIKCSS